jgi:hypothetical protein
MRTNGETTTTTKPTMMTTTTTTTTTTMVSTKTSTTTKWSWCVLSVASHSGVASTVAWPAHFFPSRSQHSIDTLAPNICAVAVAAAISVLSLCSRARCQLKQRANKVGALPLVAWATATPRLPYQLPLLNEGCVPLGSVWFNGCLMLVCTYEFFGNACSHLNAKEVLECIDFHLCWRGLSATSSQIPPHTSACWTSSSHLQHIYSTTPRAQGLAQPEPFAFRGGTDCCERLP